jgi:hypothetical protein
MADHNHPRRHGVRPTPLLLRIPIAVSAALLLAATWLPVVEIKGFDTFALDSIALWAARGARIALVGALACLLLRTLDVSRWWMALAAGILFAPLADMAVRALDLVEMMQDQIEGGPWDLIALKSGSWLCLAGLVFWLLDLAMAGVSKFSARAKSPDRV